MPTISITVNVANASGVLSGPTPLDVYDSTQLNSPSITIRPGVEFAANSFVYTPLASNAPVDPNSAVWVAELVREAAVFAGVNVYQYTPAIYIAGSAQPTMQIMGVRDWDPSFLIWGKGPLEAQLNAVPLPDDFEPSLGNDKEAIIYQPSTHKYWELWGAARTGATTVDSAGRTVPQWGAAWGGYIPDLRVNPGWFVPSGDGYSWGTQASGVTFLSTIMTVKEQLAGVINHPLQLVVTGTKARAYANPPAQRTDGWWDDPNAIPEGVCFRLPATLNLSTLGLTPYVLMVAKAAQKFGMYVTDTAGGGGIVLRAENPTTQYPNGDPYAGQISADLTGFPWSRLQAVQANLITW